MPYKEFDVRGIGNVKVYKRKSSRSLRLTVTADGNVRVSIPFWTPYQAGVAFAQSKRAWILAQPRNSLATLTHGLRIGKSHRLIFKPSSAVLDVKTSIRQTEVVITHAANCAITDPSIQSAAHAACLRALRTQATVLLGQRLAQLSAKHGISYQNLSIKRMKSRWGSCDQNGNIVLNLYLVQLPWEFIDYVILHELTHTKVMHHGPEFWHELEALRPGMMRLRKAIKMYRPTLRIAQISPTVT